MSDSKPNSGSRGLLALLRAFAVVLLPRLVCPCQMPAYVGLLSSLGLAFLAETIYLLPMSVTFLTFAVGGFLLGTKRRQGYGPFLVGVIGTFALLLGKFILISDSAFYGGVFFLLAASLWNAWPAAPPPKIRILADGRVEPQRPSADGSSN